MSDAARVERYERVDREMQVWTHGHWVKFTAYDALRVERDAAVENEQARWQERLYGVCKQIFHDVDGGGCDSGDPLDFTVDEVEQTIGHLTDKLVDLKARETALREALTAIKDLRPGDFDTRSGYMNAVDTKARQALGDGQG